MKILYLHQYFKRLEEPGSHRSYYFSKALVDNGHEVIIITSHNDKKDKKLIYHNVTIYYLSVFYSQDLTLTKRILSFLIFFFRASWKSLFIKRISICYATSTPLSIGLIALLLKFFKGIPYYFEVRDLWPKVPVELGLIKNPVLVYASYFLEKIIYQNAKKIIALSPGMIPYIHTKIKSRPEKVFLIPNISDPEIFNSQSYPVKNSTSLKIAYFGSVGYVNHLEYFVEIADYCQSHHSFNIEFHIIGEGSRLESIKKLAAKKKLKNLFFKPNLTKQYLAKYLQNIDLVYISFLNHPILETCSPNKFFDALAASKLIVVNFKGWLKDLVEEKKCGFYIDPEHPEDLYPQLLPFIENRTLLDIYKRNAFQLAQNEFDVNLLSQKFLDLFSNK